MRKAARAFLALCAVVVSQVSAADPPKVGPLDYLPALSGDYFPLASKEAGRTYHIYVRYPERYAAEPGKTYPVIYLLDGDSTYPLLAPQHLFIHYDDKIPDAIIVGIAYGSFDPSINKRHFDFSPPSEKNDEGGAPAFERFLKNELIPAVETRVRADPARRVLVGQSRGGGFVMYSAFSDPDLFWARIASSPTLRPGREIYSTVPRSGTRGDLHLIVADGTRDEPELRKDFLEWQSRWAALKGPWQVDAFTVEGGTHSADLPNVYRRAMRILFLPSGVSASRPVSSAFVRPPLRHPSSSIFLSFDEPNDYARRMGHRPPLQSSANRRTVKYSTCA